MKKRLIVAFNILFAFSIFLSICNYAYAEVLYKAGDILEISQDCDVISSHGTHHFKKGDQVELSQDFESDDEFANIKYTDFEMPIAKDYLKINNSGNFWKQAVNWFNRGKDDYGTIGAVDASAAEIISEFGTMVNILGTTVIVLVTIFLGIKYMFGTFEAKADVKESLVTLLVACVFFFGWNSIWNLLFPNGDFIFNPSDATSYTTPLSIIFSTATTIANFLAIGAILYVGIRYIFAGAEGKADLKAKSGQFLIGIILSFCAVGLLNYISIVINDLLK